MTEARLRKALAEHGWKLERSRPEVFIATRQVADGQGARERSALSPEQLLDRVREFEADLARRGGPKPTTVTRGAADTSHLTIRRA